MIFLIFFGVVFVVWLFDFVVFVLEDGICYVGCVYGVCGCILGEVVFVIGMFGYQEIIMDLLYVGQIVLQIVLYIGNIGMNDEDVELCCIWVVGYIV